MPFHFEVYQFQDSNQSHDSHAKMDAREADGWKPVSVNANFIEVAVLWQKTVPAKEEKHEDPDADHKRGHGATAEK